MEQPICRWNNPIFRPPIAFYSLIHVNDPNSIQPTSKAQKTTYLAYPDSDQQFINQVILFIEIDEKLVQQPVC